MPMAERVPAEVLDRMAVRFRLLGEPIGRVAGLLRRGDRVAEKVEVREIRQGGGRRGRR